MKSSKMLTKLLKDSKLWNISSKAFLMSLEILEKSQNNRTTARFHMLFSHSTLIFCALHWAFTPWKASQKFGVRREWLVFGPNQFIKSTPGVNLLKLEVEISLNVFKKIGRKILVLMSIQIKAGHDWHWFRMRVSWTFSNVNIWIYNQE